MTKPVLGPGRFPLPPEIQQARDLARWRRYYHKHATARKLAAIERMKRKRRLDLQTTLL